MRKLQIFRAGKHTAVSGKTIEFSAEQLQAAADAYDPKVHEAPIVVGHPKGDAPAYGWIQSLAFAEGGLDAEPIQVHADFAQLVKDGRFKKISASFYEPDCPNNPKPGVYYLRHVGFLGAQPPAVKGLRSAEFADGETGVVEFADWNGIALARIFRHLRNWILAKHGQEEADKALPEWDVENALISAATQPDEPARLSSFEEQQNVKTEEQLRQEKADLERRATEIATKEASFAERETRVAQQEAAARRRTNVDFAEQLVNAGKLLPVFKEGLVEFMTGLSETGVVEFGEGDKKQKHTSVAWLQSYLQGQPKLVDFKEHGAGDGTERQGSDPNALAAKAVEFMEAERAQGRTVSSAEAVAHVTKAAS